MNIFQKLENKHSQENSLEIIDFIVKHPTKMQDLMNCFFAETKDYRVPQRAAHVVSILYERKPEFVRSYLPELIQKLQEPNLKGSFKRNILRILQHGEIPTLNHGEIYDLVFNWVLDPKEEIAIRAFGITVLYHISSFHPDLKMELKSALEMMMEEENLSPGVSSRLRKTLQLLYKEVDGK